MKSVTKAYLLIWVTMVVAQLIFAYFSPQTSFFWYDPFFASVVVMITSAIVAFVLSIFLQALTHRMEHQLNTVGTTEKYGLNPQMRLATLLVGCLFFWVGCAAAASDANILIKIVIVAGSIGMVYYELSAFWASLLIDEEKIILRRLLRSPIHIPLHQITGFEMSNKRLVVEWSYNKRNTFYRWVRGDEQLYDRLDQIVKRNANA